MTSRSTADGGPVCKHWVAFFYPFFARNTAMLWIYLLLAGLFEIGFAMGLKYSDGFTRLWPTVLTIGLAGTSLWFLTQALKTIPVGTGYAIWTGIGALGVTIAGIALFGDSASWPRLACIGLIVSGVIGLKFVS
ncbi:SugE protein [Xanthomonas oryzae pv. oryzae KACC 10331]|uniref:Guanidinium exporter n=3 Tax=Xanthomonas oryzae pv. oryzae TaxID=64187 RepID=Q5GV64_XANOR|nr:SugE protein [Xanthomonas oryzae pv. oryzae KACC 10331]